MNRLLEKIRGWQRLGIISMKPISYLIADILGKKAKCNLVIMFICAGSLLRKAFAVGKTVGYNSHKSGCKSVG